MSGTTDADRVYVGVSDNVQEIVPSGGRFETTVDSARGGNVITVVAWCPGSAGRSADPQVAVAVPRAALGSTPPARCMGTAMLGNAEAGEGIGYVRPVYSLEYLTNPPAGIEWVTAFRIGGGAGEIDLALPSKDTGTRDPTHST